MRLCLDKWTLWVTEVVNVAYLFLPGAGVCHDPAREGTRCPQEEGPRRGPAAAARGRQGVQVGHRTPSSVGPTLNRGL